MQPFIVLFVFLILTQFLYGCLCLRGSTRVSYKFDRRLFVLYGVVLCLMLGTRLETVGTDTATYVAFFHNSRFYYHGAPTDWGFEQLGRLFHLIDGSTVWFLLWSSVLSMAGIIYLVNKYSSHKSTSLFLFAMTGTTFIMFQLYFSMVRQACALSFYIIAVSLFFDGHRTRRKLLWAVALFVFAVLVHGSTLFGLPFILLAYFFPLTRKAYWYALIWFFYVLSILNISYVNRILDFVFDILGRNKYDGYADITFGMVEYKAGPINMLLLPFSLIATALVFLCRKEDLRKWWLQLTLMGAVMTNLFSDNLMWGRLTLPLIIFSIIAIPNIMGGGRSRLLQISFYLVVVAYFLYKNINGLANSVINAQIRNINDIVPYNSWLLNLFR